MNQIKNVTEICSLLSGRQQPVFVTIEKLSPHSLTKMFEFFFLIINVIFNATTLFCFVSLITIQICMLYIQLSEGCNVLLP